MGGEISDRQWREVLGVLRVQGQRLDLGYMRDMVAFRVLLHRVAYSIVGQPEYRLIESAMKNTILRIVVGAILLSLISGIVVSIIGLTNGWASSQFSDGFFWAGAIMISIGFLSLLGYSRRTIDWPPLRSDPADRANLWAADTFRGKTLMAAFGISGLLLFGLSILVLRLF